LSIRAAWQPSHKGNLYYFSGVNMKLRKQVPLTRGTLNLDDKFAVKHWIERPTRSAHQFQQLRKNSANRTSINLVQQRDKYITSPINQSVDAKPKENTTSNENIWRHSLIKGFRISPSLLAMVESECRARKTHFSEFIRYAIVATVKRGRYAATAE